jgi:drug/metabolite transporter (DMT)-like permease
MRYAAGIAAAIGAGIADHVGVLIQKAAVNRAPRGLPLMKSLRKSPLWISGFALQFFLGAPLAVLSVSLIGPAIVPGLMSIGLVVLAFGAIIIQKERVKAMEIAGIAFVILAVTSFGMSRLSIDVHAVSMRDPLLLFRAGAFAAALTAIAFICGRIAGRHASRADAGGAASADPAAIVPRVESASAFHAVRAGLLYNLGNLGLGFITAGLARFGRGIFDPVEMTVFLLAAALAAAGTLFGLGATQHALAHGRAAVAIPLQNGVAQILPVLVFFLVYRPYAPGPESLAFLGAACALLMTGVVLLTRRLGKMSIL